MGSVAAFLMVYLMQGLIEIYLDRWKFVNSGVPGRAVSRGILYNLQLFLKMVALTVVSGEEVEMTSTNVLHYIIGKAWVH